MDESKSDNDPAYLVMDTETIPDGKLPASLFEHDSRKISDCGTRGNENAIHTEPRPIFRTFQLATCFVARFRLAESAGRSSWAR
jgi:hypothetical protein